MKRRSFFGIMAGGVAALCGGKLLGKSAKLEINPKFYHVNMAILPDELFLHQQKLLSLMEEISGARPAIFPVSRGVVKS